MSDPIYGNIQDLTDRVKPKLTLKPKSKGTFATNLNTKPQQDPETQIETRTETQLARVCSAKRTMN